MVSGLLERLPAGLIGDGRALWPPLELLVRRLLEPQVAITLGLAVTSFGFWQLLKRGLTRRMLIATVATVCCYLALTMLVVGSAWCMSCGIPGSTRIGCRPSFCYASRLAARAS